MIHEIESMYTAKLKGPILSVVHVNNDLFPHKDLLSIEYLNIHM